MKSNQVFLMVGVLSMGLCSPMALASDPTNSYSNTNTPASERSMVLETQGSTTILEGKNLSGTVIEKTVSTPVLIERATASPMVIEDRIVKQKHMFALGLWPLFDFEVK